MKGLLWLFQLFEWCWFFEVGLMLVVEYFYDIECLGWIILYVWVEFLKEG